MSRGDEQHSFRAAGARGVLRTHKPYGDRLKTVGALHWGVAMTENDTVQVAADGESKNNTIYESADGGDSVTGLYIPDEAAEQVGEFAEVAIDSGEGETVEKTKDTKSYGVYESDLVTTGYFGHGFIGSEENEDGEPSAPEELTIVLSASDEESFEEAAESGGEDAEADDSSESDPSTLVASSDEESGESDEEEVEVSDEEVGLVEN